MLLDVVFFAFIIVLFWRSLTAMPTAGRKKAVTPPKSPQLSQALQYADTLYSEKKFRPAEKAYLAVLRHDHRNVHAYSRLGQIYGAQRNWPDAIECFQIAAQFRPSAQAFYHLGLVLLENRNTIKAIAALEKSIMFEPSAARYVSLAKAYQSIANQGKTITALEKAVELTPDAAHLRLLADTLAAAGRSHDAKAVYERLLKEKPDDQRALRYIRSSTA